ncbi:MAG: FHA domain-containing protein, partial [Candidatus Flemingiibacterium sp.]
ISIMHYFRNGGITLSELYQMFLTERGKASATETAPRQTPRTAPVQQTPVKHETVKPAPVEESAPVKKEEPKKAPAKSEPESGKRGFIDWFLGKNGSDGKKSSDAQSDEIDSTGSDDSGDMNESLNILFGSSLKKAPKQPKKSEKPAETKTQKQSPFGFQKKETVAETARPAQAPAPQPVYQTEPQPYPVNDAADEETNIVGLSDSNRVYLELIDSMFPNVPKAIDIDMSKPYVTIGRATADTTGLDIAFPESCKGISRHHARITNKDGGLVITDLGSTYFTVLNGQRLVPNAEYPLTDGSVLEFVQSKPIRYRVHC